MAGWWHLGVPAPVAISCWLVLATQSSSRGQQDDGSQQNDVELLLQLRRAIDNWDAFAAGNKIVGSLQCSGCTVKAVGTLPPSLGGMDLLNLLDLQGNSFGGSLPREWVLASQFPALQNLYLNGNNLTGDIPWDGGGLPQLQLIRLDSNRLTGPLPSNLSLPNLLVLRAFSNNLTALPRGLLASTAKLQILALQQNALAGPLPFPLPPALQEIYLQQNNLTGELPPSWGAPSAAPSLRFLTLGGNPLAQNGAMVMLPDAWGQAGSFPQLHTLKLDNAQLSGPLPASWATPGAFKSLDTVLLQGNNLTGSVDSWAGIRSLQRLVVRPGNPSLCSADQSRLPFQVCSPDPSCLTGAPNLTQAGCGGATSAEAAAAKESGGGSDSGSSFPVAAVAVPVALVAVFSAVAGAGFVVWRRRRQRQIEVEEAKRRQRSDPSSALPFDTLEGQQALTSPFGAGFPTVNAVAVGGAHTSGSSSSQQYSSTDSRGSWFGPRIRTRSFERTPGQEAAGAATVATEPAQVAHEDTAWAAGPMRRARSVELQPIEQASGSGTAGLAADRLRSFSLEVPFSDWEIDPDEIEIAKRSDGIDWELGQGAFGKVYKALRNGVQPVAVKIMSVKSELRQMADADLRQEIAILKACRDPNILQFQGAHIGSERTMLVTEYMEAGSLSANITLRRVSWWRRGRKIAIDVAKGLVFLHSRHIAHFDLKSPNVLLARDGTAKVADVGMARFLPTRDYLSGVVGTLAWAAPEMLWGQRCSEKADIYSFGIVLWEICSGERPVRGQLRDLRVPDECPEEARLLILECLETRPRKRPSARQLVERLLLTPVDPPSGVIVRGPSGSGPLSPLSSGRVPSDLADQQQQQQCSCAMQRPSLSDVQEQAAREATAAAEQETTGPHTT